MSYIWKNFNNINSQIDEVKLIINNELSKSPDYIKKPLLELASSNAKYLRSGFLLLSASFGVIRDRERLLKFAAVIELFHLATLIHDDVIDDALVRRNKPALHVKYGKRIAVLMGDYLFLKCYNIISMYVDFPLVERLSKMGLRICMSEIDQADRLFDQKISILAYLRRISGKTASLFAFAFHLGALESGCGEVIKNILSRIGFSFGICFQIIDDILDFTKTREEIGKSVQTDINDGIYTLPVIFALKKDPSTLKLILDIKNHAEKNLNGVVDLIIKNGGIDDSIKLAEKYTNRSLKLINALPDIESREILYKSISALLNRNF
jgi:heptaprenyl diphosphate synthase